MWAGIRRRPGPPAGRHGGRNGPGHGDRRHGPANAARQRSGHPAGGQPRSGPPAPPGQPGQPVAGPAGQPGWHQHQRQQDASRPAPAPGPPAPPAAHERPPAPQHRRPRPAQANQGNQANQGESLESRCRVIRRSSRSIGSTAPMQPICHRFDGCDASRGPGSGIFTISSRFSTGPGCGGTPMATRPPRDRASADEQSAGGLGQRWRGQVDRQSDGQTGSPRPAQPTERSQGAWGGASCSPMRCTPPQNATQKREAGSQGLSGYRGADRLPVQPGCECDLITRSELLPRPCQSPAKRAWP